MCHKNSKRLLNSCRSAPFLCCSIASSIVLIPGDPCFWERKGVLLHWVCPSASNLIVLPLHLRSSSCLHVCQSQHLDLALEHLLELATVKDHIPSQFEVGFLLATGIVPPSHPLIRNFFSQSPPQESQRLPVSPPYRHATNQFQQAAYFFRAACVDRPTLAQVCLNAFFAFPLSSEISSISCHHLAGQTGAFSLEGIPERVGVLASVIRLTLCDY